MNIEQARAIPLALILEKLGCNPAQVKAHRSIYMSPLRNERTPSFHVHNGKNLWYDHGLGKGGSLIGFVCAYLESQHESYTVSDALRWIENMSGNAPAIKPVAVPDYSKQDSSLTLKQAKPLQHPALLQYIKSRGIPLKIASSCLVETWVHNRNSKKDFFALGIANEEGGYEIRNNFFKGCIGAKDISFIRGKTPKPDSIHVFEGVFDYLSAITYNYVAPFDDDAIVLNSLSCLKKATPYIKNYGYRIAYTWLDNDPAGEKAIQALAEFFATEKDLQHKPMNHLYSPHKDVNAWLMNKHRFSL